VSVLVVEGVCLGRSRGTSWLPVLSDASFDVEPGEVVAIVGARRAGKTTLLEIAAGIAPPERGRVRLGEHELTRMPERKRVRLRGREIVWLDRAGMSQQLQVARIVGWPLSLTYGRREAQRRAGLMLERVGALELAGKRWTELSPWELVLVNLARGFVASPKVVVIDDLLDGLGPDGTTQASRLTRTLIAESPTHPGLLMSACDRDSAVLADRVWTLRDGKLTPTSGHQRTQADVLPLRPVTGGQTRSVG
jgi:predicted ABC-type transport system involved in lysophospholipase L1 biosynthesis ATPase subunit